MAAGCKDCRAEQPSADSWPRPAPHPGPRCATHHRARRKAVAVAAHARRISAAFGITGEQYAELYAAQGGRCYVCRRSTGKARRLAVDHDHHLAQGHPHPNDQGCPLCIRGLACGPCNRDVLGRLGGLPETYERLAGVLRQPPARLLLIGPARHSTPEVSA